MTTYSYPAKSRKNLHVLTCAWVARILIEKNIAVRIEYVSKGRLKTLRARKEVTLSAGAIAAPKTLMLSALGPPRICSNTP